MDILREALKIINDRFPLDSEFEIYERETFCSITKKKWKKAYIRENADPDDYSKAYSNAGSDEDSDMDWMAKYKLYLATKIFRLKCNYIMAIFREYTFLC